MKQETVYAVLAALFVLATPAAADPLRLAQYEPNVLPPYAIVPLVRAIGVDPIDQPVRRGPAMYVMHGIDRADREVRVLIDGRTGTIVSVTPMMTASRIGPGVVTGPGLTMGPYERMPGGAYVAPEPPGIYRAGPPVVYDDEPPRVLYGMRPPADVPNAPPRVIAATPNPRASPDVAAVAPPVRQGMLPPPPDRFPQRALPPVTEKPKPVVKRAAEVPKQAPLPRPRPASSVPPPASQPPADIDAAPPSAPEVDASAVPN